MKENYGEFAKVYTAGTYPSYSRYMAERLPDMLGQLGYRTRSILDLACGEGTFVLEARELGFNAVGVDKSKQMVEIARKKARKKDSDVKFFQGDMRDFVPEEEFGLVTSWFDSMNYLLTAYDIKRTMNTAYSALQDGGYFVFDMNTIYGLSQEWQQEECYVERDDGEVFEVHRTDYSPSRNVAELQITFFTKDGDCWRKSEEVHEERAYELERIKELAREVGFQVSGVWDDVREFTPPDEESGRVWIALKKS
ncbi:MAG: class I SAM-dependent methyltransferase [Candidatus Acetothermia bacterium]